MGYEDHLVEIGHKGGSEEYDLRVDLHFESVDPPLQIIDAGVVALRVSYLPPLHVWIQIPAGYPEVTKLPAVVLGCTWLTRSQLKDLVNDCCTSAQDFGEPVLFMWLSCLKDAAIDILMGNGQAELHLPFGDLVAPSPCAALARISSTESDGTCTVGG